MASNAISINIGASYEIKTKEDLKLLIKDNLQDQLNSVQGNLVNLICGLKLQRNRKNRALQSKLAEYTEDVLDSKSTRAAVSERERLVMGNSEIADLSSQLNNIDTLIYYLDQQNWQLNNIIRFYHF